LSGLKSSSGAILITLLSFSPSVQAQQAQAQSGEARPPAKASQTSSTVEQQRRKLLEAIRAEDPADIADRRLLIAQGTEPERVRTGRSEGADFLPDATETWLVVLRRDVEDGRPLELYEQLVKKGKGTEKPEELLSAIAKTAMADKPEVTVGGEVVEAIPALSLDAGYTKASLDKMTMASLGVADTEDNVRKLKGIAEACLDGQNKKAPLLSTCYIAGLTFAAKDNFSRGTH
jgi:hypothetical protein